MLLYAGLGDKTVDDIPLCVDLDGTLIRSDLLLESAIALLKRRPLMVFLLPFWLLAGRSTLKQNIARHVDMDAGNLPYQRELIEFLKRKHAEGRPIVLVTASHRKFAEGVARKLGFFDRVYATEQGINLSGCAKRDLLIAEYGDRAFDYVGNSHTDLHVWSAARKALLVNPGFRLRKKVAHRCPVSHIFEDERPGLRTYARALRVHQWIKNTLVFVPILMLHEITNVQLWFHGLLAFASFSFCASSVYLLNDLLDIPEDRAHPSKRLRPFASGDLPILGGTAMMAPLLAGAFTIAALWLPKAFLMTLMCYYALTIAYSFGLKAVVLIDSELLAGLYTLRIIGGAAATHIPLSFWLLAFSIFMFFSLALVKRYSELLVCKQNSQPNTHGRDYYVDDGVILMALSVASGFLAVLVSAFYINSDKVRTLYRHPAFLWMVTPALLFWISRIWLITHRGQMHDDPVIFAAKDKVTWFTAFFIGALLLLAAL